MNRLRRFDRSPPNLPGATTDSDMAPVTVRWGGAVRRPIADWGPASSRRGSGRARCQQPRRSDRGRAGNDV